MIYIFGNKINYLKIIPADGNYLFSIQNGENKCSLFVSCKEFDNAIKSMIPPKNSTTKLKPLSQKIRRLFRKYNFIVDGGEIENGVAIDAFIQNLMEAL